MESKANRDKLIAQIRELPAKLKAAVNGLNQTQLSTPYREGGWTVRQVVHHLLDSHMNAFVRMKLVLTEDHPTLKTYRQEEWARLPDADEAPISLSLVALEGLHGRWIILLKSLAESDWERTAFHPDNGDMSIDDLLRIYAAHGENHVSQISGLRNAKGW